MMRVLLVSGTYPPDHCGVGDYTGCLAEHLATDGQMEVAVLTGNPAAKNTNDKITLVLGTDGVIRLRDVWKAVRTFSPDLVHIQYPTMRVISRWIPIFIKCVLRLPVVQTWHEHYRECGQLSWMNVLCLDGLIYVREDVPNKLPRWLGRRLNTVIVRLIPNGRTIPVVRITTEEREARKTTIGGGRPIVAYFGFAYQNKGVDLLFKIADPTVHHLLLICELNPNNSYQKGLLKLANDDPWRRHSTVTGYVTAEEAGTLLAIADAVVFPFPGGIGNWNTSVKAAIATGVLVV